MRRETKNTKTKGKFEKNPRKKVARPKTFNELAEKKLGSTRLEQIKAEAAGYTQIAKGAFVAKPGTTTVASSANYSEMKTAAQANALATVDPRSAQLAPEAAQFAAATLRLAVGDTVSLQRANEALVELKERIKGIEEHRDTVLGPLKQHIKTLDATYFRPALDTLEDADEKLRSKVKAWIQHERERAVAEAAEAERKAAEAELEIQDAIQAGDEEKAEEALEVAKESALAAVAAQQSAPARVMLAGNSQVSTRRSWTFEVLDPAAVPDEYWSLDEKKIRLAVKSGLREIPGVDIFEDDVLAVGGR